MTSRHQPMEVKSQSRRFIVSLDIDITSYEASSRPSFDGC